MAAFLEDRACHLKKRTYLAYKGKGQRNVTRRMVPCVGPALSYLLADTDTGPFKDPNDATDGGTGEAARGLDLVGRICASQPRRMLGRVPGLTLPNLEGASRVKPPKEGGEGGGLEVVYLWVSYANCLARI